MNNSLYTEPWNAPAILLVDLDAFFASVEQLDHPAWRGKPVIVGGKADRGGVVATCSYEARAYGVRSAQSSAIAKKLCPDAIWVQGHYDRYREMSKKVMQILRDETPHVQQVSIDEAFLDVSPTRINTEHPADIAARIQKRVEELGITCSIGVGTSKSVAKIASDMDKPKGLTVVLPDSEQDFLGPLPIRKMSGIGPSSEQSLINFGIKTLSDLAKADQDLLSSVFGKNAEMMRNRALGVNDSVVTAESEVKSVSKETTFADSLTDKMDIKASIATLASQVGRRLRRKGLKGNTVTLRVRYNTRETHSFQVHLDEPTDDEILFTPMLFDLLDENLSDATPVKLLGVGVSGFKDTGIRQERLFGNIEENGSHKDNVPIIKDKKKRSKLIEATDALKDKFGESSVQFGHELRNKDNTTGTASKNPGDYK